MRRIASRITSNCGDRAGHGPRSPRRVLAARSRSRAGPKGFRPPPRQGSARSRSLFLPQFGLKAGCNFIPVGGMGPPCLVVVDPPLEFCIEGVVFGGDARGLETLQQPIRKSRPLLIGKTQCRIEDVGGTAAHDLIMRVGADGGKGMSDCTLTRPAGSPRTRPFRFAPTADRCCRRNRRTYRPSRGSAA
jgi:hypothetical protein